RTNQSRIDYRFYTGWSQMAKKDMNMMNAEEKIQYEIDAGWRVGADADPAVVDSLINQSHDWVETIGRTARTNSHELSFSGGSEKTTYFISGNMYNQEGLVEGSFLDRITGRVNVAHKFSDRLDVGVNMTVGYYKRGGVRDRRNVQNPFYAMLIYNPYEALKLPDGEWNYTHEGFNIVEALEKNPERLQQFKSIGNFYLNWEFVKGLTFSTLAGMDLMDDTRQTFTMPSSILASYVGDAMRDQFRRRFRQNYTNYLTYKNRFDVHGITLKAGIDAQKYYYRSTLLAVQGFPSDKLAVPDAAASPTDAGGTIDEWGLFAYFGTLTYDFNQKYIIDLIGRRDASSRFGENNKWANFGAVGASWNLHEESFMESLTFLSILKLRASYGTTGNFRYIDNTGLEPYYEWMGTYSYYQYNGLSASYPGKIENPDLKWEVVKSFDAGFDFSLYNERIRGTFDYYNKKTEDLFFPRQVSRTSGFTERIENVGSMVNQGIEFGLEGDVVRTGDLIWTIGADITTLKNEITELYGEDDTQIEDGFGILKVGEPVYQFFLVRYAGVNPANGDALFYDVDGNITNVYSDADRVILDKSPLPKFYGSFYTNLSYKGIDLSALFYYNYGNHIFSYFVYQSESDGTNITDNQSRVMLDAWKQPGDITDVPETRVGNDRAYLTDRNLENGNYLRLREVTLAYNLPKSLISKIKMRSLRVYVKGTNLFTITAYKGFDPEIGYNSSETDATPVGSFDENTYPASRTFSFGIDVGF
ncbi:MAG: SusC/RagA family TonB-linked outer membrane protein, partial [Bacteroidales bacterium]